MTDAPATRSAVEFSPVADSAGNYLAALSAMRLRALLLADRWPVEEDDGAFDLVLAAALMRRRA